MKIRPVRFLPALVLGLLACDALKPHAEGADASAIVAVPAVTATVNSTATATPTDTTTPAATINGTPVATTPGQPAPHPVAHTDGGTAPAPTAQPGFVLPSGLPVFDGGGLRLPAGFDAGALHNPFQH